MNTTQHSELDRIKLKIKALAAKTVSNGCSEHEAMSAMLGVGRLLSQYNLRMEECDVRESKCKTIYIDAGRTRRHPIDACIIPLANLVNGKCWFHKHWGRNYWTGANASAWAFFGQEDDLELIKYLYHVIRSAMDYESEEFKSEEEWVIACNAGARRSATVSFQHGMAARIAQRLKEIKQANDKEMVERRETTGRALIVLKKQLVEDEYAKTGIERTLRTVQTSRSIRNYSAYGQGRDAGNKVNLSRPLKSSKGNSGLLT